MVDVICLGELLVDFVSMDRNISLKESGGFLKTPGGAPANVAAGIAKLGASSGFIGKVGEDPFGHFLYEVLESHGVETSFLKFDADTRTTLSFVAVNDNEERDCMFYRNPGADMMLEESDISDGYFKGASIFHFGSISLGSTSSEKATLKALEHAKNKGLLISYDPNLRLGIWHDADKARQKICEGLEKADLVKISAEEMEFISGMKGVERNAEFVSKKGCKAVIITLGNQGCYYSNGVRNAYVKGIPVWSVETTGAGDAFMAALLYRILIRIRKRKSVSGFEPLDFDDDFIDTLKFANCAGAIATTRMGAIPGLPSLLEIEKLKFNHSR